MDGKPEFRSASRNPFKDASAVLCDYDERHRQILDFRLPSLDGSSLGFKDIDADLILLDFWGTWCQPCLRSIPNLVKLQAKHPANKLAIIGIACEQGSVKQASPKVAEVVDRLKINYPILISKNDGSCPLQEAMHIQAFPTLILIDREGRIVWKDQESTPSTLARLERFLKMRSTASNHLLSRVR